MGQGCHVSWRDQGGDHRRSRLCRRDHFRKGVLAFHEKQAPRFIRRYDPGQMEFVAAERNGWL
jgi:hypothetical protein